MRVGRWIFKKIILLIAGALIVLAVVASALHLMLPYAQHYRVDLEKVLSQEMGHPVHFSHVDFTWDGLSASLILTDVRVELGATSSVRLKIHHLHLGIGLWSSLLSGQVRLDKIAATGIDYVANIHLAHQGTFSDTQFLHSLHLSDRRLRQSLMARLAPNTRFQFSGGLSITDSQHQAHAFGANFHLIGRLKDGQFLRVALTFSRGRQPIMVVAHFSHFLRPQMKGVVYVMARAVSWPSTFLSDFWPHFPILHGQIDTHLWVEIAGNNLQRVTGIASFQQFQIQSKSAAVHPSSVDATFTFGWRKMAQGWDFGVRRSGSTTSQSPFDFNVIARHQMNGGDQLAGHATWFDIGAIAPIIAALPSCPSALSHALIEGKPTGLIRNLRFRTLLKGGQMHHGAMSLSVVDLALHSFAEYPGFNHVDGTMWLTPKEGWIFLNGRQTTIHAPRIFEKPLPAINFSVPVVWQRTASQWLMTAGDLRVENKLLKVTGKASIKKSPHRHPDVNVALHIDHVDLHAVRDFFPMTILSKRLNAWLDKAFNQGKVRNGSMLLSGDLSQFPFYQHQGRFRVTLPVSQVELSYYRNWPVLKNAQGLVVFSGPSLSIELDQGTVMGTQLGRSTATIPDLANAVLHLKLQGEGPVADAVQYLAYTPVADGHRQVFKKIQTTGQERFSGEMRLPIAEAGMQGFSIHGRSQVTQGSFAFKGQNFHMRAINGVFHFDRLRLWANNVSAQFRGARVRMKTELRAGRSVNVELTGQYPLAELLPKDSIFRHVASGKARMVIGFQVPLTSKAIQQHGVTVQIRSDLKGIRVALPEPLGKRAQTVRPLRVAFAVDHPHPQVRADYGSHLRILMQLTGEGVCQIPQAMAISYDATLPRLPQVGIAMNGVFHRLNVDDWRKSSLVQGTVTSLAARYRCPGSQTNPWHRIQQIQVQAGTLIFWGIPFEQAHIGIHSRDKVWQTTVSSKELVGAIEIPYDLHGGTPLRFSIQKLDLPSTTLASLQAGSTAPKSALSSLSPRQIPPLNGSIADLKLGHIHLKQIHIETTPVSTGLKINQLLLQEPSIQARAHGWWRILKGKGASTQLTVHADIKNAGAFLKQIGYSGLDNGHGSLDAQLDWPGSPMSVRWKNLRGQGTMMVNDGRMNQINTGPIGKLIALINLNQLPTYLTSGFGSLFKHGFAFNQLHGDFGFDRGVLEMRHFQIDGPSANIGMQGAINILTESLNMDVTVVPQLQSTLSIAGAVAGGPLVGLGIYLFSHMTGAGSLFNKMFKIEYHVAGTFSHPVVKMLSQSSGPPHSTQSQGLF